ncbi:DsbA family protein [Candidatus Dojkabacteria bacterium]|uniref:DsbA family protein n=1 Tax=Candidatus Dojkabacteria bacterium TaxID=2099670 RepID=A0A955I5H5_9BACT|nr:DsbA family protein [Candidatus Dojkabacteria bacterium]
MKKLPTSAWIMLSLLIGAVLIILLVLTSNNKILSNVKLPVEITEFFDYQCSHCAEFSKVMREIEDEYGDNIDIQYKNFPFINDNSFALAYGAEAAREQGKFLEYHHLTFEIFNQVLEGTADISAMDPVEIATQLGLDLEKFETDRASDEVKARVTADYNLGNTMGVTGTPSVFIGGQLIDLGEVDTTTGQITYDKFRNTVSRLVDLAIQNEQNSQTE